MVSCCSFSLRSCPFCGQSAWFRSESHTQKGKYLFQQVAFRKIVTTKYVQMEIHSTIRKLITHIQKLKKTKQLGMFGEVCDPSLLTTLHWNTYLLSWNPTFCLSCSSWKKYGRCTLSLFYLTLPWLSLSISFTLLAPAHERGCSRWHLIRLSVKRSSGRLSDHVVLFDGTQRALWRQWFTYKQLKKSLEKDWRSVWYYQTYFSVQLRILRFSSQAKQKCFSRLCLLLLFGSVSDPPEIPVKFDSRSETLYRKRYRVCLVLSG